MNTNRLDIAKDNFQKFFSAEIQDTGQVYYSYRPSARWLESMPQTESERVFQISIRQSQLENLLELFVSDVMLIRLLDRLRYSNHSISELFELIQQADYRKEDEVLNTMYEQYLIMCALKRRVVDKV